MKNLPTKQELLEAAKQMVVNLEVAKNMGRKSQTRRLPKGKNAQVLLKNLFNNYNNYSYDSFIESESQWKIGDVLLVREPAKTIRSVFREMDKNVALKYKYLSDGEVRWINLPERIKNGSSWFTERERGIPNGCIKEMARTFLIVTNVRVERLQDIEYEDTLAEGFPVGEYELKKEKTHLNDTHGEVDYEEDCALEWFINLWDRTAPIGYKWEDNPCVFVYEFEKVEYQK